MDATEALNRLDRLYMRLILSFSPSDKITKIEREIREEIRKIVSENREVLMEELAPEMKLLQEGGNDHLKIVMAHEPSFRLTIACDLARSLS